MEGQLWRSIIL